jgi:hypothetical protein
MSPSDDGKKVLTRDIPGRLLLPGPRYSFNYGRLETVHCGTTFEFHRLFGGHTGSSLQTPPSGRQWIRSGRFVAGERNEKNWNSYGTSIWEVSESDLDGNYHEEDDQSSSL